MRVIRAIKEDAHDFIQEVMKKIRVCASGRIVFVPAKTRLKNLKNWVQGKDFT